MKDFKVGDRLVWVEENNSRDIKGIVIYLKDQNVKIQWYENGIKKRLIRYHIQQIQDEPRIQIDKEYYRDQKLKEILCGCKECETLGI